jgi:penicillin-insensitive murein endopeptidase
MLIMKERPLLLLLMLFFYSCSGQPARDTTVATGNAYHGKVSEKAAEYYLKHQNDSDNSIAFGNEAKGSLMNGKLVPYSGPNFMYFDEDSYLNHRAYVDHRLYHTLTGAYKSLEQILPGRYFYVMECSYRDGGKLLGHQTHQNGRSVDFMSPLMKDGKAYYGYDTLGIGHYFLNFDSLGRLIKDTSVSIDFNTLAAHIFALDENAAKYHLRIKKVILKIEYKEMLFATEYGKKLKARNIYFAKVLKTFTNSFHDDHYHIDFELVK